VTRLIGVPYKYGGRGYGGIDCSSLIVRGVREVFRLTVVALPWMSADQLARGFRGLTHLASDPESHEQCLLAFFDWDEDNIYEHAAVRLLDGSWVWSSSSVGKVVRVDPVSGTIWRRQWTEIEGALQGRHSTLRVVNWFAYADHQAIAACPPRSGSG
jgi:cell wall-associated NlpC family hydrolase